MPPEDVSMTDRNTPPITLPKLKFTACRKCHARKVKCPGGQPCQTCVQLECEAECTYPKRDRQIRVSQNYIQDILRENQALRSRLQSEKEAQPRSVAESPVGVRAVSQEPVATEEPTHNPVLEERPWFLAIQSSSVPILIGEVADAAFATRFRQMVSKTTLNHIPRTTYPDNSQIMVLANSTQIKYPTPTQARFFLRTALMHLDGQFYIVNPPTVRRLLERFLQNPEALSIIAICKILALFALGELYSSHHRSYDQHVPGLTFFSHAMKAYGILFERPSIDSIEVSLLLALYSLCINRRHSAYLLASSAVRHCTVMGLHFNIPEGQITDSNLRKHLNRVWWTSFSLDYTCAAISSQMVSISNEEIFTDLPSNSDVSQAEQDDEDLKYEDCFVSRIHLTKLMRDVMRSIYGRTQQKDPFVQRVQHALRDLKQWHHFLPKNLQMDPQSLCPQPEPITSLNLFFNQCLILTTRPVLLHILRIRTTLNTETPDSTVSRVSENALTLAEACIRCARHSYSIINESWMRGSFWTFDYFNTQYLFSAATILGISSLLGGPAAHQDREDFEFAGHLLEKLRDSGSFTAMELCRHIEGMRTDIQNLSDANDSNTLDSIIARPEVGSDMDATRGDTSHFGDLLQGPQYMTAGMALAEPSLEAFLAQSDPNLGHIDLLLENTQSEGLYWPIPDLNPDI